MVVVETEPTAVPGAELGGVGGTEGGGRGVDVDGTDVGLVLVILEELLQHLECPADLLLGDFGESEDLAEGSRGIGLAAGDEDASGDDDFGRLPLEVLGVVGHLEDVLGGVLRGLGNVHSIAEVGDLAVCGQQGGVALLVLLLVLLVRLALEALQLSRILAIEGDVGLELRAVEQGIDRVTDTAGVVVVLVVVGEGAPFGARVDDAVTENEAARGADHVARGEFFYQVRGKLATIGTLYDLIEVLLPGLLLWRLLIASGDTRTLLGGDEGVRVRGDCGCSHDDDDDRG